MYELRPERFPTLTQLISRLKFVSPPENQQSKDKTPGIYHSGMVKPKGLIIATINILWYSLEYVFERLCCYFKSESLDIYARYSCDYIFVGLQRHSFMDKKYRTHSLKNRTIYSTRRNAQDIYKEKPELSVDEIVLQDKIILDQFKLKKNFYTLPPDSSNSSTVSIAVKIIEHSWKNQ